MSKGTINNINKSTFTEETVLVRNSIHNIG